MTSPTHLKKLKQISNLTSVFAVVMLWIFVLLLAPIAARAQAVSNFSQLQSAISDYAYATSDVVVTVNANFSITSSLSIPANSYGRTLSIKSTNAQIPVTLTRGFSGGNIFAVNKEAKLILENIIIDGNKGVYINNTESLIYVYGGEFTMKDGAVLTNRIGSSSGFAGEALKV